MEGLLNSVSNPLKVLITWEKLYGLQCGCSSSRIHLIANGLKNSGTAIFAKLFETIFSIRLKNDICVRSIDKFASINILFTEMEKELSISINMYSQ